MRIHRLAAGLLAGLCAASPASTQDRILPYDFFIDDFDNGLRLVTIPTDFPDVVSVHVLVSTGSRNEVEEGKSGFAHFFEHMMFRGSKNYTSTEQAAIFKEAGADRNAYTSNDFTNYHTTVTKADLETVLKLEADRFQNLLYSQKQFRTEAMAVYGEYNKNSANPINKALEVIRDTAFDAHTYKHTTMGFLPDIRAMPGQFDYSKLFFARWYKPEYTTIMVVGDTSREQCRELVEKWWGDWERGGYTVEIPAEPTQTAPREAHIKWPSETSPWVFVAFKGPAFAATRIEMPALDILSQLAFSPSSELYRRLYVRERKVDQLFGYFPDSTDPFLLIVAARVRDPKDWRDVRDALLAECERMKSAEIDPERLADVKSAMRYGFANSLDSSEAIADALAGYVARARTPEAVNQVYAGYEKVQADDVREVARRYFVASARTIATLSHEPLPGAGTIEASSASAADDADAAVPAAALMPTASPLVNFRLQYSVGAASDPAGKEGLANLTARLMSDGRTQRRTYEQLIDDLFPLAASISARTDKQMTTFAGTAHVETLDAYYPILREVLREPGFDAADFERVKADVMTQLTTGLRQIDDEELGKEVLYSEIYDGHPFRHPNLGTVAGLESITLDDVKAFYEAHFAGGELLTIGLSGGYPSGFAARVAKELRGAATPAPAAAATDDLPAPRTIEKNRMTIVEKNARATGLHIGFPIDVTRAHADWTALWLVRSYFGEHRSENSYLYQRLREIRGLNYGDYCYIEYFPGGGGQFHPPTNVARSQQIFQIWVRPVPHDNGPFTLKAATFELDRLVRDGLTQEKFEATRNYLSKFVSLLVKTADRQLGYALDSRFYGTDGSFAMRIKRELAALTLDDVNTAIRKHLRADRLQFVVVTDDGARFKDAILGDAPTPISYTATPGGDILAEDRIIESLRLDLEADEVEIVPIKSVFAR